MAPPPGRGLVKIVYACCNTGACAKAPACSSVVASTVATGSPEIVFIGSGSGCGADVVGNTTSGTGGSFSASFDFNAE